MKKIVTGLIIGILLSMSIMAFASTREINVYINGKKIKFDSTPVLLKGRVVASIRSIAEALGAIVSWDSRTNSVLISTPGVPEGNAPSYSPESGNTSINHKQ